MLIYCVRHGESVFNAEGRIQGQLDVPLSELGERQGEAVAEALAPLFLDAIYASPLLRAKRTAEILSSRVDIPVAYHDRLKEIHAGVFQGQRREDLEQTHPVELARWRSEDLDYAIPGGETRRQLMTRGRAILESVARGKHQRAAVVAHGRLLVVAINDLIGRASQDPPVSLENGSITTLVVNEAGGFRVGQWNQVGHLNGVGLAGSGDL